MPNLHSPTPGRTNAEGCHNNRKTGIYHCHNTGSDSAGFGSRTEIIPPVARRL
ncbi:MAG TPA: YHYH domain-containing protein [Gammaproteobacteria bacterium]|nr:YHYH domain-containing protein [Gammaproteobacteria bacterium]